MKILFISHKFYPDIGGIEINSEILANGFFNAGHEIRLITWTKDLGKKQFSFPIIRNPSLSQLLRAHLWADVVFENNPSMRLSWPSLILKKPSVIAIRTWINRIDGRISWQDKLKIWSLKKASKVIAISDAVRERSCSNAEVIGNPYRYKLFRILPEIKKTVGFVFLGRLVSDKGADIAIEAIAQFLKDMNKEKEACTNLCLTIIGDGPELQALKDIARNFNIQPYIKFEGALTGEALVACLNKHRFILIPSRWEEPFGNVALEGMACGCVPIVSDGGGLKDAVGNAGITFTRGNVNSLVENIMKVFTNPVLEANLRNAANNHLTKHYPEVVSQKYLRVIEDVMNN